MNKPYRYTFHDERDPEKRPRYFVASPMQQHKILNDYIREHQHEHYLGDGQLIEIPLSTSK